MMTDQTKPLYEGKAKQIFNGPEENTYVMRFKDQATAFDGAKKADVDRKGLLNQKISAQIFEYLKDNGVKSHYIKTLNEREMLVTAVEIVPIEVVVRNISAGSVCRRYGIAEKIEFNPPIVEFFYKDDALHDPLLSEDVIKAMKWATQEDLEEFRRSALQVNELLQKYFGKIGITLVDFKLEYGRDKQGNLLLADEVTPDGCRLWDTKTGEVLDKDRFRKDLGDLTEGYQKILDRIDA